MSWLFLVDCYRFSSTLSFCQTSKWINYISLTIVENFIKILIYESTLIFRKITLEFTQEQIWRLRQTSAEVVGKVLKKSS